MRPARVLALIAGALVVLACTSSDETSPSASSSPSSSDGGAPACDESRVRAQTCSTLGEHCSNDVSCCRCMTGPTCAQPRWVCQFMRNAAECPTTPPQEGSTCAPIPGSGSCVYCTPSGAAFFDCNRITGLWADQKEFYCATDAGK